MLKYLKDIKNKIRDKSKSLQTIKTPIIDESGSSSSSLSSITKVKKIVSPIAAPRRPKSPIATPRRLQSPIVKPIRRSLQTHASLSSLNSYETTKSDNLEQSEIDDQLFFEEKRLLTFENWPISSAISKDVLARIGLFYIGHSNLTKCYFCKTYIQWKLEENIDIVKEHLKYSPNCPLLQGKQTSNIPLNDELFIKLLPTKIEYYPIGNCSNKIESPNNIVFYRENASNIRDLRNYNLQYNYIYAYPKYMFEEERVNSFKNWPISFIQTPEQLANAGFFYTNEKDIVTCYYCGKNVKNWSLNCNPWTRHVITNPSCVHIKLKKGQKFVDSIIERAQTENDKEEEEKDENEKYKEEIYVADKHKMLLINPKICNVYLKYDSVVVLRQCGHIFYTKYDIKSCSNCSNLFNETTDL